MNIETPVIINIPGVPTVVTMTWLAMLILIIVSLTVRRRLSIVPGRLQNMLEFAVETLTHLVESIMGPAGGRFVPFLGTLFLLILVSNYMGLMPGLRAPTSSLNTTVALALAVFVVSHYYAIRTRGLKGYLLHYTGHVWYVAPLMVFSHVIGEIARPFSLAIRLFANILGDDLAMAIILSIMPFVARMILPLFLPPLLVIIDALIAFIQALVFSILAAIYIDQLAGFNEMEE